jgi:hypothetical protein
MNHFFRAAVMLGGALLITTGLVTGMQQWAMTRHAQSVMATDVLPSRSVGGRSALQPVRLQPPPEECKPEQGDTRFAPTQKFTPISSERKP